MRMLFLATAALMALGGTAFADQKDTWEAKVIMIEGKRCLTLSDGVLCPGEGPKCIPQCTLEKKDDRPVCQQREPLMC